MANSAHLPPGLTQMSDAIISIRHELGMLRADLMERFDQNAAATAALHGRINEVEDNVMTHCSSDALNNAVTQSQNILNTVATDVATFHTGLRSVETAITACRQGVSDAQETITQAIANTRQELSESVTALRSNLLDAVSAARHEIYNAVNTVRGSVVSMRDGFGAQLNNACETIITQTSLTRAPSRDVLNGKIQEIEGVIEHVNTSVQNLPNTLHTSLAEAMITAANDAARDTERKVKENLQELHTQLDDKLQEVQLEMRAGHFNSAARLANKLSSCCTSKIVRLRGIDNLPIHSLPKTYVGLQDLEGNIDEILERFQLRTNVTHTMKRQQLKIYLGLRK